MPKRKAGAQLGFGEEFDRLLGGYGAGASLTEFRHVDPRTIRSSPFQPRIEFSRERIAELAASIRAQGLLQPLLVRSTPTGLELLAGERRKRAAVEAQQDRVPIRVVEANDAAAAAIALTENLHREDLTAWEEAQGFAQLRDVLTRPGKRPTRERLSEISGRSTGWVSEALLVAERVTEEVIQRSGVDRHIVTALPQSALVAVAKGEDDRERARLLALAAVSRSPGRTVEIAQRKGRLGRSIKPYTLRIHRKGDRAGQVAFAIRSPAEIDPASARKILEGLQPVLEALRQRADSAEQTA